MMGIPLNYPRNRQNLIRQQLREAEHQRREMRREMHHQYPANNNQELTETADEDEQLH